MIRHGPLEERKDDMGSLSAMPPVAMCQVSLGSKLLPRAQCVAAL